MPDLREAFDREQAIAMLDEAIAAYRAKLFRSALHGAYDAFSYLAEVGRGHTYDREQASTKLETDEGGHRFRLKTLNDEYGLLGPVFRALDGLGRDRRGMKNPPFYRTPSELQVWQGLDATISLYELVGVDVQDIRDSLPQDEPLPSEAKPSAWRVTAEQAAHAVVILEEAIMAYQSELPRSALHGAYDVVNFVGQVYLDLRAKDYQMRLDCIHDGDIPARFGQYWMSDAVWTELLGLGVQRNRMVHDLRHRGASEPFCTPAKGRVYEAICSVVVFLSDLGAGLKPPDHFELPQQTVDFAPSYELDGSESDQTLRFYHPVWPSLQLSPYVSHELGLTFLAPSSTVIRESSNSCIFELDEAALSVALLERMEPEAWLEREVFIADRIGTIFNLEKPDGVTLYCLEGYSPQREDQVRREIRLCTYVHAECHLLTIVLSGRTSYLYTMAPVLRAIVDSISELMELPWQRYEESTARIDGMVRDEFAHMRGVRIEKQNAVTVCRRYGLVSVVCKVLPGATVTKAKLYELHQVFGAERRVYVAEPYKDEAKMVLAEMNLNCTLLTYVWTSGGELRIVPERGDE